MNISNLIIFSTSIKKLFLQYWRRSFLLMMFGRTYLKQPFVKQLNRQLSNYLPVTFLNLFYFNEKRLFISMRKNIQLPLFHKFCSVFFARIHREEHFIMTLWCNLTKAKINNWYISAHQNDLLHNLHIMVCLNVLVMFCIISF